MRAWGIATLCLLPSLALAAEPAPWEGRALTGAPGRIVAAAKARPTPADVRRQLLYSEDHVRFAADGSLERRRREVYRLLTDAAVESDEGISGGWNGWYQDRPELRARVITSDGVAHVLDPTTIEEGAPRQPSEAYSDYRVLRAPLPALEVGAIIETEVVTRDRAPLIAGGMLYRSLLAAPWPTDRSVITIEAPDTLPLHWLVRGRAPLIPTRRQANGTTTLTFTPGPTPAYRLAEGHDLLADWPRLEVTAARSWNDIAADYARVAEKQLASADAGELERTTADALAHVDRGKARVDGKGPDARAVVAALATFVRRQVRYTGLWLGNSSIVPHTPAQTLQRKYGDCKDRALLLTALLRTAGISSQLALLRVGKAADVEDSLPSISQFDHVIVFVPGKRAGERPIWVDPGADPIDLDALPEPDAGRLALLASASTRALTKTPVGKPEVAHIVLDREVRLAENGPARLVEKLTMLGTAGRALGAALAGIDRKRLGDGLALDIARERHAIGPVHVTVGDPARADAPFSLGWELISADDAESGDDAAIVRLLSSAQLRQTGARAGSATARGLEQLDIHTRILVPPGFSCSSLPASGDLPLGPMHMARRFAVDRSGAVTVDLRLDLTMSEGGREMAAMLAALDESVQHGDFTVTCPFEAHRQQQAGHIAEALAELHQLSALHPTEARHHAQLAIALVEVHLGQAARVEAERAVALEPLDSFARSVHGWALMHDVFGRFLRPGSDRAAAAAELERSLALDATTAQPAVYLSQLYSTNGVGEPYAHGVALDKAIAVLRKYPRGANDPAYRAELWLGLAHAGRWKELLPLVAKESDPLASTIRLAGLGLRDGASALLAALDAGPGDTRQHEMMEVARLLWSTQHYKLSAPLYERLARSGSVEPWVRLRADLGSRLVPADDVPIDEKDPTAALRHFDSALFDGEDASLGGRLRPLLASDGTTLTEALIEDLVRGRQSWRHSDTPLQLVRDSLAAATFEKEGDEHVGYRIRRTSPLNHETSTWYVERQNGRYLLWALPNDVSPLARRALRFVDEGDLAAATRLLDWVADGSRHNDDHDPLAQPPFLRVWEGHDTSAAVLKLAATLLLVERARLQQPELQAVLARLETARAALPPGVPASAVDMALVNARLMRRQFAEALALTESMAAQNERSATLFGLRVRALLELRRADELRRLAERRLGVMADDPPALRALARAAELQSRWADSERACRRLVQLGKANYADYNELAWDVLFHQPAQVSDAALDDARRSVELSKRRSYGPLHTLASLQAERGLVGDAAATIVEAIDTNRGEPGSNDFYVLGRIAEQLGLRAEAAADYQQSIELEKALAKAHDVDPSRVSMTSTQRLAEQRLRTLPKP